MVVYHSNILGDIFILLEVASVQNQCPVITKEIVSFSSKQSYYGKRPFGGSLTKI